MKIMVSACLTGLNVKYNGGNNLSAEFMKFAEGQKIIPVCPESLGGLKAPRPPAEIVDGRVMNKEGVSVDREFRAGAEKVLEIAKKEQPDLIVLQSRSPSCGVNNIYDGSFTGKLKSGSGVTAELLIKNGFKVIDIEDLPSIEK